MQSPGGPGAEGHMAGAPPVEEGVPGEGRPAPAARVAPANPLLTAALAGLAAVVLAGAWFLATAPAGPRANLIVADALPLVACLAGAIACGWRMRHSHRPLPWQLMTVAAVLATLAEGYWATMRVVLERQPPDTSAADILYLGTYGLFLAAFIAFFPPRATTRDRARRILDAAIVSLLLFSIVWILALRDLIAGADAGLGDSIIVGTYPAMDLAIACILVVWARELPPLQRRTIHLMALGLVLFMAGSLYHAYDEVTAAGLGGSPKSMGWAGGYLAFALAAAFAPAKAEPPSEPMPYTRASLYFVYMPLAILIPVAAQDYLRNERLDVVAFFLGVTLLATLAARQILLTSDMRLFAERLQHRDRLLGEAQTLARLGDWKHDLLTDQFEGGPQHHRNWGFPEEHEPTRAEILAHVHPEDRKVIEAAMVDAAKGARQEFDHRVVWPDGSVHWLHEIAEPRQTPGGAVVAVVGTSQDITEGKLAADAHARLAFELRTVVEAAPLPVIGLDELGRVVQWNAAAERTFGWPAKEAVGALLPIIPPEGADRFHADIRRLQDGLSLVQEVHPRTRDGRTLVARLHVAPLRDGDGHYRGCVALLDDLTSTREAEAKLRQAEDRERVLQEVAEFKTRFLNTAAHELATPITPLKLQLSSLQRGFFGEVPPEQRKGLLLLERNVDRLGRLVQDLLEAARLQSGSLRLNRQQVDLNEVATDVAESLRAKATEEGLQLEVATHGPAVAQVDADRIHQVLFNLVHNSIKFTPRNGRIVITVDHDQSQARLSVDDTGVGLTDQQRGRLFEPFVQVHDAISLRKGGTGLGLYISRGIAEQHGGRLDVTSSGPGRGSRFTLSIPLVPLHAPPRPTAAVARARENARQDPSR